LIISLIKNYFKSRRCLQSIIDLINAYHHLIIAFYYRDIFEYYSLPIDDLQVNKKLRVCSIYITYIVIFECFSVVGLLISSHLHSFMRLWAS